MLRSLYSGISGLRAHQTMMDVTGNNIANVNTVGYKAAATVFQDTMSQVVAPSGRPQPPERGGVNAAQIGLGVRLASITNNFREGSDQPTGVGTDLKINGDGFFVLREAGQSLYTRSGAFNFDSDGNLVNPNGAFVQGYPATGGVVAGPPAALANISIIPNPALPPGVAMTSYSINTTGEVIGVFSDDQRRTLGQIATATFVNPNGLEKAGNSNYRSNTDVTGAPELGAAGTGQRGTIRSGTLEMSNVDLAQEFTNLIVAQRGFQANSRIITTSDELLQELVNLKR